MRVRPDWFYGVRPGEQPPAHADRMVLWLARRQWRTLLAAACLGVVWMLSAALVPAAIGRAVDDGIVARDGRALLLWSAAVLGLGLLSGLAGNGRHWFAVKNWLVASFRSGLVADHAVLRAGPALTRELPAGEVLTSFTSDFGRMGHSFDVFARFCGAVVSFVVVAVILLRGSVVLGMVMLIGGPLLVASLGFVVRPLQRRQAAQREEAGRLTALGADTVAGLRVLRGVGGEDAFVERYRTQSQAVRAAGVRVAGTQALLDASQVLLPGIFVLVVTGLGARLAVDGAIAPGQLVAFYGYTAFLTIPLQTAVETADKYVDTRVAAGRIARLLTVAPSHPRSPGHRDLLPGSPDHAHSSDHRHSSDIGARHPRGTPARPDRQRALAGHAGALRDPRSGVVVDPGRMTALVSARPDDTAAVAGRLGRVVPGRHGVRWGDVAIDDLPVDVIRQHVVVSQSDPRLFSGPVRGELGGPDDDARLAALDAADAGDALAAVDGLDGALEEAGRSLSGGQRQRIALARALLRDPEVLVLVEPTSAVDAHTEARIAERLGKHRRGRTTVVVTASPLLLEVADTVLFLDGGQVTDSGTHRELTRRNAAYRSVVIRGDEP
ncbi:MAG: ABC transporter transmembrane domain-containing protein [Dermatophilaceae bacterium]